MEYGIWNIHGSLWTTNPIAYNNTSAIYTNRLPPFSPFHNTSVTAIPEILKTSVPLASIVIENEAQQTDSDTNDSSEHSNSSQIQQEQKETQTEEPEVDNDNATDFISNFALSDTKIENSLAFINQQFNPVYNLMLSHLTKQQELPSSDNDETNETKTQDPVENNPDVDDDENKHLFECSLCHAGLGSNDELQRHLEIKHFNNEVIVSTRPCTQTDTNVGSRELIDKKNYNDNSNSSNKRNDRLSLQRVRYEREEYRCTLCTYTCTIEKAFYRHLRAHSVSNGVNTSAPVPRISCVICGKDRASENEMVRHMQKHKDNRHFCCDICIFRTVQLKKLIQHRRMHTGEKPHLCPHCIYRSARRDNLRSHVRRVHKKDNLFCDTFSPRGLLLTPKAREINEVMY